MNIDDDETFDAGYKGTNTSSYSVNKVGKNIILKDPFVAMVVRIIFLRDSDGALNTLIDRVNTDHPC